MKSIEDIVRALDEIDRSPTAAYLRPRDAATLLILDVDAAGTRRVLMGRRHERHRFMPGAWVFPGGRVDPGDGRVARLDDYDARTLARLCVEMKGSKSPARARAFAVAALRETWEEAGLLIGRAAGAPTSETDDDPMDAFVAMRARGLAPSLAPFRFVARAITPPGRPRRFDTRFFAVGAETIAGRSRSGVGPSGELEDVAWVTFAEARARRDLPPITRTVLDELENRLAIDPDLSADLPVPFYRFVRGRFVRTEV